MRVDNDGYHLRQSDIETFLQCPEQLRLRWLIEDESSFESDAATVGTVVHACIEHEITGVAYDTVFEAKQFAAHHFLQLLEKYASSGTTVYSEETFGGHTQALKAIEALVESWFKSSERDMLLHMEPADIEAEWYFDRPFLDRGSKPTIWLAGTSDLVIPERNIVWDWKTSSSAYKKWEKQRWAIQPTVYLWAAQDAGLIKPDDQGRFRFDYKVFVRAAKVKPPDTVDVYRTMASFEFLAATVDRMVNMIEKLGTEDPWPLNDHSALCGPKWCPFWNTCKGAIIDGDKWH